MNIETNVIKPELLFKENDNEYLLLDKDMEDKLDSSLSEIEKFMKENEGKGKSDEVKETLYKEAQQKWKKFGELLKETKYNFFLNRKQYKFLWELIANKIEYDTNTIFFAIELTDMLNKMKKSKFDNDDQLIPFPVDATEITYIYHLISKHKVRGLNKDSYTFSEILIRIGNISKVFNYYETTGKNLTSDIQNWVACFEDNVNMEKRKIPSVPKEDRCQLNEGVDPKVPKMKVTPEDQAPKKEQKK